MTGSQGTVQFHDTYATESDFISLNLIRVPLLLRDSSSFF